jgi:hypothetical protein
MEEGQVTVDGVSHPVPQPFTVIATQNPTGAAGTQLLPDSQMDRFMIRLTMGYPGPADEMQMVLQRRQGNPLDGLEGILTLQQVLQIASGGIIIVLLVVSLLIISNTVKISMYDRRDEIAIMKMVGATNGFIRMPFVVEGFTLGATGAALAFGLEWWLYDTMIAKIEEIDTLGMFHFVPFETLLIPMIATFGFAALFVGIIGIWTSIRKFMDV